MRMVNTPQRARGKTVAGGCSLSPVSLDWSLIPEICELQATDLFIYFDPATGQLAKAPLSVLASFFGLTV